MSKSDNQKLKILYILDYLQKHSSPEHPVKAAELIEMLQRFGIACERRTIYSDIQSLQDFGIDITNISGRNGGYYVCSRDFELPELKLLVDAVASSRFLTEKKSRELIGKLCTLCNAEEADLIRRNVFISNRVKSMNESIYYNVDTIQEALSRKCQITFRYFDWGLNGQRIYRDREYIVSPYGLSRNDDNYYLVALSPRHGNTQYRIDRMSDLQLLDIPREPCEELTGKNLTEYCSHLIGMFSGKLRTVKIEFHKDLSNSVIDRFGSSMMLLPGKDDEHFVCTVKVAVAGTFFGWLSQFGTKAKILYPKSVKEEYVAFCRDMIAQYQDTEKD